jgi:hypothetical protein
LQSASAIFDALQLLFEWVTRASIHTARTNKLPTHGAVPADIFGPLECLNNRDALTVPASERVDFNAFKFGRDD